MMGGIIMSSRIRDIEEFCRLYRIRIPVQEEFDYYIHTLSRSPEFDWLPDRVEDFARFERQLKSGTVGSYKMEQLKALRKALEETETYKAYAAYEFEAPGERKDLLSAHDGRFLVSVDIHQADFSIFKAFDESAELPGTWEDLCEEMDISPVLADSIAWRQMLFGKLISKRNQRLQHLFMEAFVDLLRPLGLQEEQVLSLGPNDLTLVLGRDGEEAVRTLQAVALIADLVGGEDCSDRIPVPFQGKFQVDCRPIKLESLRPGAFLKTHYVLEDGELDPDFRSLYGVPGNQYFLYFKDKVLRGRFDRRDLMFMTERRLAQWVI